MPGGPYAVPSAPAHPVIGRPPRIPQFTLPFSWAKDALCRRTGPYLFDEVDYVGRGTGEPAAFKHAIYRSAATRRRTARMVCQVCPVLSDCATHVMTTHEPYGLWAGLSSRQRMHVIASSRDVVERVNSVLAMIGSARLPTGMTWAQFVGTKVRRANRKASMLLAHEEVLIAAFTEGPRFVDRVRALERAHKVHATPRAS